MNSIPFAYSRPISKSRLAILPLGIVEYGTAYQLQNKIHKQRVAGEVQDTLLLLEHPPTITLGKSGKLENILVPTGTLAQMGISLYFVDRGGDVTYHGPGQLVIYPIVNLKERRWSVVDFVGVLEELMIRTLADWEIRGERNSLNRGVWVGMSKIGSIGIAVRRFISFHGLALNVNMDLDPFTWINPCGLQGVAMTSMKSILGQEVSMPEVIERTAFHMQEVFGVALENI